MDFQLQDAALPIATLLIGALLSHLNFVLKRNKERANEKDDLDIEIKKLDLQAKKVEYQRLLDQNDQQPVATSEIRSQIEKTLSSTSTETITSATEPSLTCMIFAEHGTARAECISDRMGDIVLNFSGGSRHTPAGRYDVTISLNVNCTNQTSEDRRADVYWIDATSPDKLEKGLLQFDSTITFRDVEITPPGAVGIAQYRISNLRVNMSQLSLIQMGDAPANRVYAFISIEPHTHTQGRIAIANHMVDLSNAILGCITTSSNSLTYIPSQQGPLNQHLLTSARPELHRIPIHICLREGFPGAFRTKEEENPVPDGNYRLNGTRFRLQFFNIPTDVHIFVTRTDVALESLEHPPTDQRWGIPRSKGDQLFAVAISGADSRGGGGVPIEAEPGFSEDRYDLILLKPSGGFATCTWEWIGGQRTNSRPRTVCIGIAVASHGRLPCVPSSAQVAAGLAPVSTVTKAASGEPTPRFIDTTTSPRTFFTQLGPLDDESP